MSIHKKQFNGHDASIAVVGAGMFGTSLAASALAGGNNVTIFDINDSKFEALRKDSELSGCELKVMDDGPQDLAKYDLVILAPPSQALRAAATWVTKSVVKHYGSLDKVPPLWIVSAAKGIEQKTLLLPNQILREILPPNANIAALSGPSFAKEMRAHLPTAVVIASASGELRERAKLLLHRSFFRCYDSSDILGVELGGALKNVIAMVAGGADGLGLGNNARAAVITRGLGEIAQVGVKLGADPMTFLGLSGLGDLILTCTGDLSRNRQFGLRLAKGESKESIVQAMGQVIEGVTTAESAYQLSQKFGLDTPILKAAYSVLYNNVSIQDAVLSLVQRGHKGEFDWIEQ